MQLHLRLFVVVALVAGAFTLLPAATANAAPPAPTCGPYITLTPSFGEAGTVVSVNLFQFPANDEAQVILRVAGDPVVATGTTDEYGHANILFTMREFSGSQVAILATASPCYAAGAYFEFRKVTPTPIRTVETPTPTATPTTPGTVTPTTTTTPPTTPPTTVTRAAITTPTPKVPLSGSGGQAAFGLTGGGANLAIAGLALVVFSAAFVIWGSSRHFRTENSSNGRNSKR